MRPCPPASANGSAGPSPCHSDRSGPGISCYAASERSACAAFSRKAAWNSPTPLTSTGKSGVAQWRDLRCAPAHPQMQMEAKPPPLVISTGADPEFPVTQRHKGPRVRLSPRKPHEARQRHQPRQEIRRSAVERSLCGCSLLENVFTRVEIWVNFPHKRNHHAGSSTRTRWFAVTSPNSCTVPEGQRIFTDALLSPSSPKCTVKSLLEA